LVDPELFFYGGWYLSVLHFTDPGFSRY
jgi:hypothetical protein